jgi:signal transduction histidine kinase
MLFVHVMDLRLSDVEYDASANQDSPIPLIAPHRNAPPAGRLSSKQGKAPRAGAKRTVLLVEDSAGDARLIEILAHARGFSIDHVLTAAAARERLKRGGTPDVVLLGLRLPDAQPMAAARQILRAAGPVPVVVLTGLDDDDLAHHCIDIGAQDYICKSSLTEDVLYRAIEHAIARQHTAELSRRVELAERQAALGRLAATVAHEINNQAAVLLANAERAQLQLAEVQRDAAARVEGGTLTELQELLGADIHCVRRIADLVRELQAFARAGVPQTTVDTVDVNDVAARTVLLAKNELEHTAALELHLGACPHVIANPHKLAQVLLNLLTNAAEAIVAAGPVAKRRPRITVRTGSYCGRATLSVEDTGVGIPAAARGRVFEPFFTSKPAGGGSGLGLAISAEIVASFGGTIELQSEASHGSRFTVYLPAAPETAPLATGTRSPEAAAIPLPRRRVLIVDDNAWVRRSITRLLAPTHEVVELAGGAAAIELLRRDRRFDAVLCDLTMPQVDGAAVCAAVEELDSAFLARVVILTGGSFTSELHGYAERHPGTVVAKPASRQDLLEAIERVAQSCGDLPAPPSPPPGFN